MKLDDLPIMSNDVICIPSSLLFNMGACGERRGWQAGSWMLILTMSNELARDFEDVVKQLAFKAADDISVSCRLISKGWRSNSRPSKTWEGFWAMADGSRFRSRPGQLEHCGFPVKVA